MVLDTFEALDREGVFRAPAFSPDVLRGLQCASSEYCVDAAIEISALLNSERWHQRLVRALERTVPSLFPRPARPG